MMCFIFLIDILIHLVKLFDFITHYCFFTWHWNINTCVISLPYQMPV